jgi:very-short-patch-repair endonuclease
MTDNKIPFENSFASHEKAKYWSDKNELKPENIKLNYPKKALFNCNKCKHIFEQFVYHIVSNNVWCPYCPNKKLCENAECIECFEKSFASQDKSKYWSNKNIVLPRNIFKSSGKKYYFNCNKCSHTNFLMRIADITNKGNWCSFCSNQELCKNNKCDECFEKSFASQDKSKYWSDKNKTIPRQRFKLCMKKCWFDCDKCNHSFEQYLNHVNNGVWCPYCANKKLCYNEDCLNCFNKSYASHKDVIKWSIKNIVKPRNIFKVCYKEFIFDCDKCGNDYKKYLSKNSGCPHCQNKTETILYEYLYNIYLNIIKQYKVDWCKNIRFLPFDFCIKENKIIIELDGRQHFEQVSNWSSPEEQFENDKYKEKCANDNGYSIIRLLQEDIFYDKYDWKTELINNIEKIKIDNIIQNIYMCKNNEYEKF